MGGAVLMIVDYFIDPGFADTFARSEGDSGPFAAGMRPTPSAPAVDPGKSTTRPEFPNWNSFLLTLHEW